MLISDQIRHLLMQHPVWALLGAAVAGYLIARVLLKRRKLRRESFVVIPDFLSGRPDLGVKPGPSVKGDWLEMHPAPRRFPKG